MRPGIGPSPMQQLRGRSADGVSQPQHHAVRSVSRESRELWSIAHRADASLFPDQKVSVPKRRQGIECGIDGQEPCVCDSNFCCKAPDQVRSAYQNYNMQWQTGQGQAEINCKYGICNVTLDHALVPGCGNLNCLNQACDTRTEECHVFSPQHCTSCRR